MKRCSFVDVGTNSILYLLVEISSKNRIYPVSQKLYNVRLGEGMEKTGIIDYGSLDVCIDVLKRLKKLAEDQQAEKLIAVGTQVFRKAKNREQAVNLITKETGIKLRVLTEKEEAEASYAGAIEVNTIKGEHWVVDVGGGSTEIMYGRQKEVINFVSIPLGAVGLTERCIRSDPPTAQELSVLSDEVFLELNKHSFLRPSPKKMLIGVGGTITTAAAIHCHLTRYEPEVIQGQEIQLSEIQKILKTLCEISLTERKKLLSFDPERADIIIAGLIIIQSIMEKGEFQTIKTSDFGLRWGLAVKELTSLPR